MIFFLHENLFAHLVHCMPENLMFCLVYELYGMQECIRNRKIIGENLPFKWLLEVFSGLSSFCTLLKAE